MKSLDELYLTCRDEISKKYILEAIKCYKGGAFRSCIVATWIALTYDFIGKLHELSMDDENAKALFNKIEDYRIKNNINGTLEFERTLLDTMKDDYSLLSPVEYNDLKRLNEDRNLCAHPSLIDEITPFQATTEIARYHLRNVIEYVLSKPPVQGKAALERVKRTLDSIYYPEDEVGIEVFLNDSPLGRAKDNLKIQFVNFLVSNIVSENIETKIKKRCLKTLSVFINMNYQLVKSKLFKKMARIPTDIKVEQMYFYCVILLKVPELLEYTSESDIIRMKQYIQSDAPIHSLKHFYRQDVFKVAIEERIEHLDNEDLVRFLVSEPINKFLDKLIHHFSDSNSFDAAAYRFSSYILPLSSHFSKVQISQIIQAIIDNYQINHSFAMDEYYLEFCEKINHEAIDVAVWKVFIEKNILPTYAYDAIVSKIPELKNKDD